MPAVRIAEFDLWRPGYANALVRILKANTLQEAPVFYDAAMTDPAPSTQSLEGMRDADGKEYGRFTKPLYCGLPYQLRINEEQTTGIIYPNMTNLDGANVGGGTVTVPGGVPRSMQDRATRSLHVLDFGDMGQNISTNTSTVSKAISKAAETGAGVVHFPPGAYPLLEVSHPGTLFLEGVNRENTVLQFPDGGKGISGQGAFIGIRNMILDGVNQVADSTGLHLQERVGLRLENVILQRFHLGMVALGGSQMILRNVRVNANRFGAQFKADAVGRSVYDVSWIGGAVEYSLETGLIFEAVVEEVSNFHVQDMLFNENIRAMHALGLRRATFVNNRFTGNLTNWKIQDGENPAKSFYNTSRGIKFDGGLVFGGRCEYSGRAENIIHDTVEFNDADIQVLQPENILMYRDCSLIGGTTITGSIDKTMQTVSSSGGSIKLQTTGGLAERTLWSDNLRPGQLKRIVAIVTGRALGTNEFISCELVGTAYRYPSEMAFDSATGTIPMVVDIQGITSGARGRTTLVQQNGVSGMFSVQDVDGTFLVGETLQLSNGMQARAASAMIGQSVVIGEDWTAFVGPVLRTPGVTDWDVRLKPLGEYVRLVGYSGNVVNWSVDISTAGS